MKLLIIGLTVLFLLLQYKLWFDHDGIGEIQRLRHMIVQQTGENQQLQQNNTVLSNEVNDLQNGTEAIEARARNDLGMTKSGETYYEIVEK